MFIRELYTDSEFEYLLLLFKKYEEAKLEIRRSNPQEKIYFLLTIKYNGIIDQIKNAIQLECRKCKMSGSLKEFIDDYDYVRKLCHECNKYEHRIENFFKQYQHYLP